MHLFRFPILKTITRNFDQEIAKVGLQKTMLSLIKKTQTKIEVIKQDKNIDQILENKSVILVANHPHEIEPILLFALTPPRKSAHIIATAQFTKISKNLDKHIIPVYIQNNFINENRKGLRLKFAQKFIPTYKLTEKQEREKNIENIKKASQKLSENSLIIIFPSDNKGDWYDGVGYLLKQAKTKNDIYFVKAHIEKTSRFDLFRIIPLFSFFMPKIKITFSKAQKVNKLRKFDPKKIRQNLEKDYKDWIKTLS